MLAAVHADALAWLSLAPDSSCSAGHAATTVSSGRGQHCGLLADQACRLSRNRMTDQRSLP